MIGWKNKMKILLNLVKKTYLIKLDMEVRTLVGAGLQKGTLIKTPSGQVAIENIRVGNIVSNHLGGTSRVAKVSAVYKPNPNNQPETRPIVLPANFISAGVPSADLLVLRSRAYRDDDNKWHHPMHTGVNFGVSPMAPEYYDIVLEKPHKEFFYANDLVVDSWDNLSPLNPSALTNAKWLCENNKPCVRGFCFHGVEGFAALNKVAEKLV